MVVYEVVGGLVILGLILIGLRTVLDFLERKSRTTEEKKS
jgi:hypothetical protein